MSPEEIKAEKLRRIKDGEVPAASADDRALAASLWAPLARRNEILRTGEGLIPEPTLGDKLGAALDPSKVAADAHAGVRGVADAYTLGAGSALNRILGIETPDERAAIMEGSGDRGPASNLSAADIGNMTGAAVGAVGGPAAKIATGANDIVHGSRAAMAMGGAQRAGVAGALAGGAMGAVQGANDAVASGADSPMDILSQAAETGMAGAVTGGVASAGAHVAGEAARGLRGALRKGEGKGAQYLRSADRGVFDDGSEISKLEKGEPGIIKAAQTTRDRIATRYDELSGEAMGEQAAAKAAAVERTPTVNNAPVLGRLDELARGNRVQYAAGRISDEVKDAALEKTIDEARRLMGVDELSGDSSTANLLELRKYLSERGAYGQPSGALTPENRAARTVRDALRSQLRDQVPGLAAADDAFSAKKGKIERGQDFLFGSEDGASRGTIGDDNAALPPEALEDAGGIRPDIRPGKASTAARRLARVGDTSGAGLFEDEHVQQMAKDDPEGIGKALQFMRDKKLWEQTRVQLPTKPRLSVESAMETGRQAARVGVRPADATLQAAEGGADLFDISARNGGQASPLMLQTLIDAAQSRRRQGERP